MSLERKRSLLAVNDDDLVRLIDRLDREALAHTSKSRRSTERFHYRVDVIPFVVYEPGVAKRKSVIYPRNISPGGISCIHRGFLHIGTEIHLVLRKHPGEPVIIKGAVRYCRHIEKMLHEIGVQFEATIDPAEFCEPELIEDALKGAHENTALPKLSGRILFVTNDVEQLKLFPASLESMGAKITPCSCIGAAIDALKTNSYTAIITDDALAEISPSDIVQTFRTHSHTGLIICLTWTMTNKHTAIYKPDGLTSFFQRPIEPHLLAAQLAAQLDVLHQNPDETRTDFAA